MSDERKTWDPCPVGRNVALGIKGLAECEKLKSAMQEKVFIEFLRKVAEIKTRELICDERGTAYAERRRAPEWFETLVKAAKEAVKKIEEAKE